MQESTENKSKKIVLVAALEKEITAFLKCLGFVDFSYNKETLAVVDHPNLSYTEKNGMKIIEVKGSKLQDMILICSGMGVVNAAAATQFAIDRYNPYLLFICGMAGCLSPKKVKAVISKQIQKTEENKKFYNQENLKNKTILLSKDQLMRQIENKLEDFPTIFAQESMFFDFDMDLVAESYPSKSFFTVSKKMQKIFLKFLNEYHLEKFLFSGTMASSNKFVSNVGEISDIKTGGCNKPLFVDMESSAVAQICVKNGIEYFAFKTASDNANESYDGVSEDIDNLILTSYVSAAVSFLFLEYYLQNV